MNLQNHGRALPDNVVMFPGTRSLRMTHHPVPLRPVPRRRAIVMSGAELNARLSLLLGICVGGATVLVSAVHFLQG
jgi:hypothetical protein